MGISRKNSRNSKTHLQKYTHNSIKMFFNHPTMFETPMFYQPRPVYYQRRPDPRIRPRSVYRRPQPERSFSFSPFMDDLNDIYSYPPARQQTIENECNCENCRSRFQKQVHKMEAESETESLESRLSPEISEVNQVTENQENTENESFDGEKLPESPEIDHKDSETEQSESGNEETEEKIEDSQNYKTIIEISKQSEAIQKDLENPDLDCLDEKQEMKKLRYAAENHYKLIEKLDMIHTENIEERNLRKSTVKSIQRRLDSLDKKL